MINNLRAHCLAAAADGSWNIAEAAIAYGGVAAVTVVARQVGCGGPLCS